MEKLTPIADVLAPSFLPGHTPPQKISPRPYVYLKLVRLRPVAGVDVSFRMRLSDGVGFVHAYFGSTAFDRFVHNGSIRVGQVLEIRTYKIGIHGGDRGHPFVGLVWIYPVPLVVAVAGLDASGGGAVNDRADAVNDNAAADGVDGQDRATTTNNGLQAVDPAPEPEAPVHGGRKISPPKLTDEMLKMNRTMLNNLSNKNMRNANFLAVVLDRRRRPDSHTIPKQDWYLWDESSSTRKTVTILSVWGDLCAEFQPLPGTVVALWNVQINTRYEDNPASARLLRLPRSGLGHLNAYRNKHPKGMLDPRDVQGYRELREAWGRRGYM